MILFAPGVCILEKGHVSDFVDRWFHRHFTEDCEKHEVSEWFR